MPINSRQKGKRGELEVAHFLTDLFRAEGYDVTCRRGQQYCGNDGSADVVGIPGIFIEVKFVQQINVDKVLNKATQQARKNDLVLLFFKSNNTELKVAYYARNLLELPKVLNTLAKIAPQLKDINGPCS